MEQTEKHWSRQHSVRKIKLYICLAFTDISPINQIYPKTNESTRISELNTVTFHNHEA